MAEVNPGPTEFRQYQELVTELRDALLYRKDREVILAKMKALWERLDQVERKILQEEVPWTLKWVLSRTKVRRCAGCGILAWSFDAPMIKNWVWTKVMGMGRKDLLCVECMAQKLGRPLVRQDLLASTKINQTTWWPLLQYAPSREWEDFVREHLDDESEDQ